MVKRSDQKLSPRLPLLRIPSVSSGQGLVSCSPRDMFHLHHLQSYSHPWCCSGMWSPPFLWDENAIRDTLQRASKVKTKDKEKRKKEGGSQYTKMLSCSSTCEPLRKFFSCVFERADQPALPADLYKAISQFDVFLFLLPRAFHYYTVVKADSNILMLRRSWNSSEPVSQAKQVGWKGLCARFRRGWRELHEKARFCPSSPLWAMRYTLLRKHKTIPTFKPEALCLFYWEFFHGSYLFIAQWETCWPSLVDQAILTLTAQTINNGTGCWHLISALHSNQNVLLVLDDEKQRIHWIPLYI